MAFLDLFDEGSNTALASHALDSGEGWTLYLGAMLVSGGNGYVIADSAGAGNRFRVDTALGTDVSVEGDFELSGTPTTSFPGIAARATSATSAENVEFVYDVDTGSWTITEVDSVPSAVQSATAAESAPSGVFKMRLVVEGTTATGYANGVQKVQITGLTTTTGQYVGLVLGNFSGNTANHPWCHEFRAGLYPVSGAPSPNRFIRRFPHLRM